MSRVMVRNLDALGIERGSDFWGAPCIDVKVSFDVPTRRADGMFALEGLRDVIALIDTGADFNLLDSDLIPPGLPAIQQMVSHGVTGSEMATNYPVTLQIVEADHFLGTGVISMPPGPRPYQMILGRKFLQNVRFTWDGHHGITALDYFDNPDGV